MCGGLGSRCRGGAPAAARRRRVFQCRAHCREAAERLPHVCAPRKPPRAAAVRPAPTSAPRAPRSRARGLRGGARRHKPPEGRPTPSPLSRGLARHPHVCARRKPPHAAAARPAPTSAPRALRSRARGPQGARAATRRQRVARRPARCRAAARGIRTSARRANYRARRRRGRRPRPSRARRGPVRGGRGGARARAPVWGLGDHLRPERTIRCTARRHQPGGHAHGHGASMRRACARFWRTWRVVLARFVFFFGKPRLGGKTTGGPLGPPIALYVLKAGQGAGHGGSSLVGGCWVGGGRGVSAAVGSGLPQGSPRPARRGDADGGRPAAAPGAPR